MRTRARVRFGRAALVAALLIVPFATPAEAQMIIPGPSSGGSGTPGGTNGQIQYNNSGAFGGLDFTGTSDVVRKTSPTITSPVLAGPSITGNLTGDGNTVISGIQNLTTAGTLTANGGCYYDGANIPCTLVRASANTANAIVQRDSGGNFAAGTMTGNVVGNVTGTASGNTLTVASGTSNMGTANISSGACATAVTTAATGAVTTDNLAADFNSDPTGATGWGANANGGLFIVKYLSAGNVNFKVCNNTANTIAPGAVVLQWRVLR